MSKEDGINGYKKGEEKFRVLFEMTSNLVIIVNGEGEIIDCNSKITELLGYNKKEVIGHNISSIVLPEHPLRVQQCFEETIKTGKFTGIEFNFLDKEGKKVNVLLSISTLRNGSNFNFLCVAEKIIDTLNSTKNQISEDFYSLLNSLPEPILIHDIEGNLIDVNSSARSKLNITKNNYGKWESVYPETVCSEKSCSKERNKKIETNPILEISESDVLKLRNKSCLSFKSEFNDKKGNKIEIEVFRKIIRLKSKEVVISFIKDVTIKNKTESTLIQFNEVLRLINKILSHDILNDLTVVSSSLEMFNETKDSKFLENAARSVQSSVELIRDMKELESLIHSGETLRPLNVDKVLKSVAMNYNFDIRIHTKAECCDALANKALAPVIDNIIRNAIIHSGTERIEITTKIKGEFCEIHVADFGKGISDEIKEKVFDEGFVYGETGNSGIGLYIVKKTVEKYGGEVLIKDNTPSGCIFILKLRRPKS